MLNRARLTILTLLTGAWLAAPSALTAQEQPSTTAEQEDQAEQVDPQATAAQQSPWWNYMHEGDVFSMEGDYYRAISRYKLYMMHEPLDPERDELRLKIAWIYTRGDKRAAAARELGEIVAARPEHDRLSMWAMLYYGQVAQEARQASLAERAFDRVLANCAERGKIQGELVGRQPALGRRFSLVGDEDCHELEVYARVGLARHHAQLHDFKAATKQLELVPKEAVAHKEAAKVAAYVNALEIPHKSPGLAGALSIVPGLGHFYIEEYGAGVAAMIWNGIFIYAVTDSILAERYGQASLLGLIELLWYSGTIFGAVSGAHRFNRDARRIVEEGLARDLDGLDDPKPWTARFGAPMARPQLRLKLNF